MRTFTALIRRSISPFRPMKTCFSRCVPLVGLLLSLLLSVAAMPLHAQDDYDLRRARNYLRERRGDDDRARTYMQRAEDAMERRDDYERRARDAKERADDYRRRAARVLDR